jgi:predicted FMN-binding regulatory protein PaiB
MLFCHVASENAIWRSIAAVPNGAPVVCVFDGPHHYISPMWYKSVCMRGGEGTGEGRVGESEWREGKE